jgi:hypothetical protein
MTYDPFKEFLNVSATPAQQKAVDRVNEQLAREGFVDPAVYLAVFSSPEGLLVLQDLHQRFADVHRFMPGEGADAGFYREGMAAVVYHIGAMIERAAAGETEDDG